MLLRSSEEQFITTETLEKSHILPYSKIRIQESGRMPVKGSTCLPSYGKCPVPSPEQADTPSVHARRAPALLGGPTAPHLWSPPSQDRICVPFLTQCSTCSFALSEFQLWSLINQHKLEETQWPTCWMGNKFTLKSQRDKWQTQQKSLMKLGSKHPIKLSCFSF